VPQWSVVLPSWIIQDGNYGDFEQGQIAEFALEFSPVAVEPSVAGLVIAEPIAEGRYRVTAQIIYLTSEVWVLDFGLRVFQESRPPEGLIAGMFVTGDIWVGIDPFFYFERLSAIPTMPSLSYSWRIDRISQQTAPFIEQLHLDGTAYLARDEAQSHYRDIPRTDAWHDDRGKAEYVLHCTLSDAVPRRAARDSSSKRRS